MPLEVTDGKTFTPKLDEYGRMYREVRCPECRAWICDEYIRNGRARFKCFRCGKILILIVRPRRGDEGRTLSDEVAARTKD